MITFPTLIDYVLLIDMNVPLECCKLEEINFSGCGGDCTKCTLSPTAVPMLLSSTDTHMGRGGSDKLFYMSVGFSDLVSESNTTMDIMAG